MRWIDGLHNATEMSLQILKEKIMMNKWRKAVREITLSPTRRDMTKFEVLEKLISIAAFS